MISDIESRRATDMASTVQVLMSTYNGTDYLREQIDSILAQDHPHVRLLVRDDGSSDGTVSVLREHETEHENVDVITGENLGVTDSFFRLLERAGDADYYAFSDQDDVWKKDKLSRAVASLEREQRSGEEPFLYFSRLEFVDENLNHLGYSPKVNVTGFRNALIQNQSIGCTSVINAAARRLLVQDLPDEALMHDWWVYAVVSAFGRVVHDPTPTILYRQHSSNVVGDTPSRLKHFFKRLRRFMTRNWKNDIFRPSNQARRLAQIFGDQLGDKERRLVERMVWSKRSLLHRFLYALTADVERNSLIDTLLFRFMVFINRY
jgi:glycosyltransferase involved in cell wall biosynthesis